MSRSRIPSSISQFASLIKTRPGLSPGRCQEQYRPRFPKWPSCHLFFPRLVVNTRSDRENHMYLRILDRGHSLLMAWTVPKSIVKFYSKVPSTSKVLHVRCVSFSHLKPKASTWPTRQPLENIVYPQIWSNQKQVVVACVEFPDLLGESGSQKIGQHSGAQRAGRRGPHLKSVEMNSNCSLDAPSFFGLQDCAKVTATRMAKLFNVASKSSMLQLIWTTQWAPMSKIVRSTKYSRSI